MRDWTVYAHTLSRFSPMNADLPPRLYHCWGCGWEGPEETADLEFGRRHCPDCGEPFSNVRPLNPDHFRYPGAALVVAAFAGAFFGALATIATLALSGRLQ